jgi:NAD-dependent oxidoreductase involved in siderophore biosynthesis
MRTPHKVQAGHGRAAAEVRSFSGSALPNASSLIMITCPLACLLACLLACSLGSSACASTLQTRVFFLSDISHLSLVRRFGPVQWGPSKFKPTQ